MEAIASVVIYGTEGVEETTIPVQSNVSIGRDKTSDIRIKNASISRKHARLFIDENGQYQLEHLSGTNPTIINGVIAKDTTPLLDGDVVTVGNQKFLFKLEGAFSHLLMCFFVFRYLTLSLIHLLYCPPFPPPYHSPLCNVQPWKCDCARPKYPHRTKRYIKHSQI